MHTATQQPALPRFQPPTDAGARSVTPTDTDAAEELVLGNVDLYTDWLGGACMGHSLVLPVMPRDVGALQLVVDNATVPTLVAMLLSCRADLRAAASNELRERFLAAQRDYIVRLADDMAGGVQ